MSCHPGNGWAAAGMFRVLETLRHSSVSSHFETQQADLTSWVQEIINNTWTYQVGLLENHERIDWMY